MNIKAWLNEKLETVILGNLAANLDAGKYGPRLQSAYRFGKGYATWTGAALAIVFAAAAQFDNTGASMVIAQVCAGLAGLGLVRKGAHMEPPQIPPTMRDALQVGGSIVAYLLLTAQGVVYACDHVFHASWVCGVSDEARAVVFVLTAVSGFVSTYAAPPLQVQAK